MLEHWGADARLSPIYTLDLRFLHGIQAVEIHLRFGAFGSSAVWLDRGRSLGWRIRPGPFPDEEVDMIYGL
jgi:hypothetical protein